MVGGTEAGSIAGSCLLILSGCCGGCFGGSSSFTLVAFYFLGRGSSSYESFSHRVMVLLGGMMSVVISLPIEIAQELTAFLSLFHAVGTFFPEKYR